MGPSNKIVVVSIEFLTSYETESENATKHVAEEIQSCLPFGANELLWTTNWPVRRSHSLTLQTFYIYTLSKDGRKINYNQC